MDSVVLKQVLMCVEQNRAFSSLAKKNYTYGQIAEAVINAGNDDLIVYENERYKLTAKGQTLYDSIKTFEPNKINEKYYRRDKLSIDEIYVPSYNI